MFNCQRVSRRSNKHEAAGVYAQTQRATVNRITQHIVQASTAPSAQVKRFHAKNTRSVKINQPLTPGFHPNLTAQFNPTMTLKWFKRRFCTLFNMYDDFFLPATVQFIYDLYGGKKMTSRMVYSNVGNTAPRGKTDKKNSNEHSARRT